MHLVTVRGRAPLAHHGDLTAADAEDLARIYQALGHAPAHIQIAEQETAVPAPDSKKE